MLWLPVVCHMPGTVLGAFHFPGGSVVKDLPANEGDAGSLAGLRRCLEEENEKKKKKKKMTTHSSVPARRIPWTEEPGGQQSMGS